jgi:alpha-mannosidase
MPSNKADGTCYFLGHSHLDAAWLWPFSETKKVFRDTCETVLRLMEKYPDWYFCQSSAQYYKWLEEEYPETFDKVKKRIREGRWEIVGGSWIEPDGNLLSGESYVRQYLYGKRYFKQKFGVDVKVAWMPDSFGYAWTLPQIMKGAGMQFFLTQKMSWNDTTLFPYYVFRWKAPDGSVILAHQNVGDYSESVAEADMVRQMNQLYSRQKLNDLFVLFGIGNHGGGVAEEMIRRSIEFVEGKKQLRGIFQTAKGFLTLLEKKVKGKKIPEVNDELYLQYHRGTYTTQGKVKRNNRRAECLLEVAEKFSTLARKYGYKYPSAELKEAWEKLLLNQFHDVLPGSSIPEVYQDSEAHLQSIFNSVSTIVSQALFTVAAKIDTTGEGRSIVAFNPLSWTRSDVVEVPLKELGNVFEIYDEKGQIIPSQIIEEEAKVIFIAEDVPSLGYKEYKARRTGQKRRQLSTSLSSEDTEKEFKFENEFLAVKIDKKTGLVTSIFDKAEKKGVLKDPGNVIQIFDDTPAAGRKSVVYPIDASIFDAWEIYIYQQKGGTRKVELTDPLEVRLVERGPVRARILAKYKYAQEDRPESIFVQEIILYYRIPFVQFKLHVDWHAKHRLAKVAFPLSFHSDSTTYEVPYGFITRMDPSSPKAAPADKAKYEVPAQKWIDHSSEREGYGVSLLNDCKYGFDSANDVIRMTLLRSAQYPFGLRRVFGLPVDEKRAETEVTDQGEHDISYALYPHASDFRRAMTVKKGYEFNYPLLTAIVPIHEGILPKSMSFASVRPDNVVLTVMKKAEDSDDMILRFYEISGKHTNAMITVSGVQKNVKQTDMMENEISDLSTQGEIIRVPISKHEIKTIKLITE